MRGVGLVNLGALLSAAMPNTPAADGALPKPDMTDIPRASAITFDHVRKSERGHDQISSELRFKLKDNETSKAECGSELRHLAIASAREGTALQNVPGYLAGAALLAKIPPDITLLEKTQEKLVTLKNSGDGQLHTIFLKDLGYSIAMLSNSPQAALTKQFREFASKLNPEDNAVVDAAKQDRINRVSGATCSYEDLLTQRGSASWVRQGASGMVPLTAEAAHGLTGDRRS